MLTLLALLALPSPALADDGPDSDACAAAAKTAGAGSALDEAKLGGLDAACLQLVALAPKVRHGLKLREPAERDFFMKHGLYAPTPGFNEALMDAVDHENVKMATEVAEDKGVLAAVSGGDLYAVGPGCATPSPGPVTAICLDGTRATARLNSVNVTDGPQGPTWDFDLTMIAGEVDVNAQGCLLITGHHGVRPGGAKPDASFEAALGRLCAGRGASCTAVAGDLDGDGSAEGLLYVTGEGKAGSLSTELYVATGGGPERRAQLCTFGG